MPAPRPGAGTCPRCPPPCRDRGHRRRSAARVGADDRLLDAASAGVLGVDAQRHRLSLCRLRKCRRVASRTEVTLAKNPVIFVAEVGAAISTVVLVTGRGVDFGFQFQVSLWLWLIVLLANFAEAMAEGRGKAQAKALRNTQAQTFAKRLKSDGTIERVPAELMRKDDVVVV